MLHSETTSPSINGFHVGPVSVHMYALDYIVGIALAVYLGCRRWIARGGNSALAGQMALWALPAGLIGAGPTSTSPPRKRSGTRGTACSRSGPAAWASGPRSAPTSRGALRTRCWHTQARTLRRPNGLPTQLTAFMTAVRSEARRTAHQAPSHRAARQSDAPRARHRDATAHPQDRQAGAHDAGITGSLPTGSARRSRTTPG